MKTEAELQLFFESRLSPLIEPLEQCRLVKIKKLKRYLFGTIPCIFIVVLGIISKEPFIIFILCLPLFFILGFALQTLLELKDNLQKPYKNKIFPELLSFLFDDYEYIANQRIAKSVLEKSMLFANHITSVQGEDFMRFKIGHTSIMFCETIAWSDSERTVFQGIFISASFNKNFTSKTFVLSAKFSTFFQRIKRQLLYDFKRVKLEDIEFESEFHVLSDDQVESRYILTPGLMKRILDYKRKTKKDISLSFVDNRLYCAIPNYINLFEPALFEPFNFEFIKKNYYPLKLYTDIVNDLNLNLRIWSKQ